MKVDQKRPVPSPKSAPVPHTPGPWSLEYDGSVVIGGQISVGPASCGPDDVSREERKANCRLIAAAPDLLAAAKVAASLLVGEADACEREGKRNAAINVRDVERALSTAIAKATGGVA